MLSDPSPEPSKNKPRGIPMWMALVVLLILMVVVGVAIGGLWYYTRSDKLKMQRQLDEMQAAKTRTEAAAQQAAENTGLALARTHQDAALAQVRSASALLSRLLADSTRLQTDAAALTTNESGRVVALFPDLVNQARHFYDSDLGTLPAREETITKLEGSRRIEQQLIGAAGTAYTPTNDLSETVQGFVTWAEPAMKKTDQLRQILAALIQESKIKYTDASVTTDSPTLETAIKKSVQSETAANQQIVSESIRGAKTEAAKISAEAQAKQIISEAERQRDEILAKAKEDADKLSRDLTLRQAQGKVEDSKTQVAVQNATDEARKVQLRKKASDPAIQAKLAPFTTPGYIQIGQNSYDKKPFSLTELQNFGALEQSMDGLNKLVNLATWNDKVRPRWNLNRILYKNFPDKVDMAKEAQQLLIELGPVLVEMGLLQP